MSDDENNMQTIVDERETIINGDNDHSLADASVEKKVVKHVKGSDSHDSPTSSRDSRHHSDSDDNVEEHEERDDDEDGDAKTTEPVPTDTVEKSDSSDDEVEKAAADSTSLVKKAKKPPPKKASPKKAETKQRDEESDDDRESDEEAEGELKPGLLERPVVLEKGMKRAKKKIQRLEIATSTSPRDKKVGIPEGRGTKLGDMPIIEYYLNKTIADELKPLHKFLFGRTGTQFETKRNIRKFCGFSFDSSDREYYKKVQVLSKFNLPMIKFVCEILDIERGGTKDVLIERVMEFLLNPKDSGKPLPKSKRRKSSGDKKKKRKRKRKSKKEKDDGLKPMQQSGDDSDKESSDEDSEEEEVPTSKKKTKAVTPKKSPQKKKEVKKKEVKKKAVKKSPKKETKKPSPQKRKQKVVEVDISSSSDSSDDEAPLAKRRKSSPTDSELESTIKRILDGADLESITMKKVCRQVYDKYPAFDLSEKKDFIKSTVKRVIK